MEREGGWSLAEASRERVVALRCASLLLHNESLEGEVTASLSRRCSFAAWRSPGGLATVP